MPAANHRLIRGISLEHFVYSERMNSLVIEKRETRKPKGLDEVSPQTMLPNPLPPQPSVIPIEKMTGRQLFEEIAHLEKQQRKLPKISQDLSQASQAYLDQLRR
jgi:hypothetical protein